MGVRIVRESWVVREGGGVAVNVKSGVVITIDEAPRHRLYAYHLSNRQGSVELSDYPSKQEAVNALDGIVNSAG